MLKSSEQGLPARQREIGGLLRLMGGLLADSYLDACRLLHEEPRMTTASHLVGHLAREIESGMRQLLTSMVPPERIALLPCDVIKLKPSWKGVVDEICSALGVPENDSLRQAWKSLAWHSHAHRGPLRAPRPIDDRFLKDWAQFELVLREIGRRYEGTFLATLPAIDALAKLKTPTKTDLGKLKNEVPQSIVAMRRFFDSAGPEWFPLLRTGGFLRCPPNLTPDEDGMVTYVPWPSGRYLARVAADPTLAVETTDAFWGAPRIPDSGSEMILVWNGDRYDSEETHLFAGVPR